MKLYTYPPAPNPTKLRVYLREKGLEIPEQKVDLLAGEQEQPAFRAINPLGGVPVLETDDGTRLCESLAIIEYLEELHPEPPMIGTDPLERARVRALERTIDLGVLIRVAQIVHNTRSPIPGRSGIPGVAEARRAELPGMLRYVDAQIGDQPFVAGERPSIADCTLYAAMRFGGFFGVEFDPGCTHLHRWYQRFSGRPSAQP